MLILHRFINSRFARTACNRLMQCPRCEVALYTISFNNPQVVELQIQLIKQFLSDQFVHIVCDNSPDTEARALIKAVCEHYRIPLIALPPNPWSGIHPSMPHGCALNWVVHNMLPFFPAEVTGFLDHDIFPVTRTSIIQTMQQHSFYGLPQQRKALTYLWPGFFFAKQALLRHKRIDFSPSWYGDTGVRLHQILAKPGVETLHASQDDILFTTVIPSAPADAMFFMHDNAWLHVRNASGWQQAKPPTDRIVSLLRNKSHTPDLRLSVSKASAQ